MNNKNFKIFYRVLQNKTTSAYLHSTRSNLPEKSTDKSRTEGYRFINPERIHKNLFVVRNKNWTRFNGVNRIDIRNMFRQQTSENFLNAGFHTVEGEVDHKKAIETGMITQYIVGISPRWFEQKDIVKYDVEMTKWGKLSWGIQNVNDNEGLIEVFSNISKTVITERDDAYQFQNFVGSIIHLDEKSPHMHMFFTNIDDTGDIAKISYKNEPKYNYMRDKIVDNINESKIIKYDNERISLSDRNQNNHAWWKENFSDHMEKWLKKDWEQKINVQKNKEDNEYIESLKEKQEELKKELNKEYLKFTDERSKEDVKMDFLQRNLGYFDIDDPEVRKKLGLDSAKEVEAIPTEATTGEEVEQEKNSKRKDKKKNNNEVIVIEETENEDSESTSQPKEDESKDKREDKKKVEATPFNPFKESEPTGEDEASNTNKVENKTTINEEQELSEDSTIENEKEDSDRER